MIGELCSIISVKSYKRLEGVKSIFSIATIYR